MKAHVHIFKVTEKAEVDIEGIDVPHIAQDALMLAGDINLSFSPSPIKHLVITFDVDKIKETGAITCDQCGQLISPNSKSQ